MATDNIHRSTILDKRLFSEPELATRYGKTIRTLQRWRAEGYGPTYLRIGGSIFYRLEDIEVFEISMRQTGEGA
jgi:hypothetical protein